MPAPPPHRVRRLSRPRRRVAFAVFLLIVAGLVFARRHASGDLLATPFTSVRDTRLTLTVRSDDAGMEIANATAVDWHDCTVTILGGYTSGLPLLGADAVITVPYGAFALGAAPLDIDDGFGRAFRSTDIACAAPDGRTQHAVLR